MLETNILGDQLQAQAHILLVEDEPLLADLITVLLEQQGHRVTTASGPATAEAAASRSDFDLVVSDLMLAGAAAGLELIERLLDQGRARAGLLMSGHSLASVSISLPDGVSFLEKPFGGDQLVAVTSDLLNALDDDPPQNDAGSGTVR